MKAEIISIGTELLLGEITDTNTPFIAGQLATLGIDLYYTSAVGDNYERLLGALRQAWQRSDLIITTGGLGPTQDDITRDTIAGLLGEKMEVDAGLKQNITDFFARRGLEMPEGNIRQATLIPSATAIINPLGTAPGWWVEKEGRIIAALPGPPGEILPMWQKEVFPRLEKRSGAIILSRTIKTWGLSEAKVDELVAPFLSATNPTVATYAKSDGIHLRITAKAVEKEAAIKMVSERESDVRGILGDHIWGVDDETLEEVVGQLLVSQGLTLAVAESFTGGFLSYTLTRVPESSSFFKGGIIAIADDIKSAWELKPELPSGEAGAETAAKMASLARAKLSADIGIGVDLHTEPDGETAIGRVSVAVDTREGRQSKVQSYSGRPRQLVRRAVQHALFDLRNLLLSR
jgi:nicotinamide-nucleotide amidase